MKYFPILQLKTFSDNTELDVYANTLADHLENFHKDIHKPHTHNFFLVVLFTEGKGTHSIDFKNYPVQPGSLYFLSPGQVHHWTFEEKPQGYVFFHDKHFYEQKFPNKNINNYPMFYSNLNASFIQVGDECIDSFRQIMIDLFEEFLSNKHLKKDRIALLLDLFYIHTTRYIKENYNSTTVDYRIDFERIKKLEFLIEEHYRTEKSNQFYADQLNLSIRHLNRIVKNLLDQSIKEIIMDKIILEANMLLLHSTLSIKEIAEELGYEGSSYFCRLYKSKTGNSPQNYREKYL
jgi:AraC-like DNA-binding protein